MIQKLFDTYVFLYIMGGLCATGIVLKLSLFLGYCSLIKESDSVGASKKRWMKQMKLKFETCYQLKIGVNNVDVFVDKYVSKRKFCGILLSTWENISGQMITLCLLTASCAGILGIVYDCGKNIVLFTFLMGAGASIFVVIVDNVVNISAHKQILYLNLKDYFENYLKVRLEREHFYPEELSQYRKEYFKSAAESKLQIAGSKEMITEKSPIEESKEFKEGQVLFANALNEVKQHADKGQETGSSDGSSDGSETGSDTKSAKRSKNEAKKTAVHTSKEEKKDKKFAEKESKKIAKLARKEDKKANKFAQEEMDKTLKLAKIEDEKAGKLSKKEAKKAAEVAKKEAKILEKYSKEERKKADKLAKKEAIRNAAAAKLQETQRAKQERINTKILNKNNIKKEKEEQIRLKEEKQLSQQKAYQLKMRLKEEKELGRKKLEEEALMKSIEQKKRQENIVVVPDYAVPENADDIIEEIKRTTDKAKNAQEELKSAAKSVQKVGSPKTEEDKLIEEVLREFLA